MTTDEYCERCGRGHDLADDEDLDWDALVDDDGDFEAIVCPDCITDEELEEGKTSPTWWCARCDRVATVATVDGWAAGGPNRWDVLCPGCQTAEEWARTRDRVLREIKQIFGFDPEAVGRLEELVWARDRVRAAGEMQLRQIVGEF